MTLSLECSLQYAPHSEEELRDIEKELRDVIRMVADALGVKTEEEGYRRGYLEGFGAAFHHFATFKTKRDADRACNYFNRDLLGWKLNARRDNRAVDPPQCPKVSKSSV